MSEQQKQDSKDLAVLLKNLSEEERLQLRGVIVGMKLGREVESKNERGNKERWKR